METVWFSLVAVMFAMYVVFDGFDLGAGIIHLFAARTDQERQLVLRSIGPVWDGNEVWLIAGGGTLFFAFPTLYASSFSGLYLPLMIVLWLLVLRGISIEFRNHFSNPVWTPFWDVVFSGSSLLLTLLFGIALGNIVRGVPLDADGWFYTPLWTDFRIAPRPGILDWYTIPVGVAALFAVTQHGALWLAVKTDGPVQQRSRTIVAISWWGTVLMAAVVTALTWSVQPQVAENLSNKPLGWAFPLLAAAGAVGIKVFSSRGHDVRAFLSSCVQLVGMLTTAAFGIYPYVLPSVTDPSHALTVHNAATTEYGLRVGLAWWIPGMMLVSLYFLYTYRSFAGKVSLDGGGH